jgi:hypothetical protein
MRKIFVDLTVRLVIDMEEGVELFDVIDLMDYNFTSKTANADIVDMEIADYVVTDSK